MIAGMPPLLLESTAWRYYRATMLPLWLSMVFGSLLVTLFFGFDAWIIVAGGAVGGLLGTAVVGLAGWQRARLYLADGILDAPDIGFRARLSVPIVDIDADRSSRRGRFQHLLGERHLWLRNGRRIVLNERWYPRGALADLWRRLGCQP
jgi:hypothetical protein